MPYSSDIRGCAGTWRLYDNWSGYPAFSGYDNFSGYELDNPTWQRTPGSNVAWSLVAVGTDNRIISSTGGINDPNSTLYYSTREFIKTDPSCTTKSLDKYDCINGACLSKSVYGTPGIYDLNACEQACGIGCSGKCVSSSEWAQIQGLANSLRNRACN